MQQRAAAPCECTGTPLDGWQSQPLSLDETLFEKTGTLVPEDDPEPTFSEYLPDKTSYWSADAPVAPRYFPVQPLRRMAVLDLRATVHAPCRRRRLFCRSQDSRGKC
ncbi:hypothetical protein HDG32_001465 [Paraburkholderia sp. CI2]|nr:hypothetical protein [Paraburkholderia sp. CI2]